MQWLSDQLQRLQAFVAIPGMLAAILVVDVLAYFGGLLYWYGDFMLLPLKPILHWFVPQATKPIWTWPFIPDCPLFGLLGGLGLLIVTAHTYWSHAAQLRTQRYLLVAGALSMLLWLSASLPGVSAGWADQRAMLAVWAWSLLLSGALFLRAPAWLLTLFACGQIKYGIWTITAWLVFWRNTALEFGSPLFTFDSVFMTITHIGLFAEGVLLLTYLKPNWTAVVVSFAWFALSDFMDYGVGVYPPLPLRYIPLPIMQWSTIAVTILLAALMWWLSLGGLLKGANIRNLRTANHNLPSTSHTTKVGLS
jgi:uncharacterized membrane protein YpjA